MAMSSPILSDTSRGARLVQLDLFRRATPQRRAALAISWSQTAIFLARQGLCQLSGGDDSALSILFVRFHYGDELADKLKGYLEERGS